jgi:trk system potassium uptake protein TrkH
MWPRFHWYDVRVIAHNLGLLIMILGVAMALPLVVSLIFAEWATAVHYVVGIGVALTVGGALRLAFINPKPADRRDILATVGLGWIVGAMMCAVPLMLSGHYMHWIDALFETVSGFSCTGLSMVQDLDHMAVADNMWRFIIQFLGGQGIVVLGLSMGLFTKSGTQFYNAEGRDEAIVPNMKRTAGFIIRCSLIVITIGTVLLTVTSIVSMGMGPVNGFLNSLWITIGCYETSGFAAHSLSMMYYHSWIFEILSMVLMLAGAVNFSLYAFVGKSNWREFFKDLEVRTNALWIAAMVVVFVASLVLGHYLTDPSSLVRRGIFTIISAATSTGYQVLSTNQITTMLGSGAFFLIAVAMTIGGSAGSTAGGIKALRVGIIAKGLVARIKQVLLPQSARVATSYEHLGHKTLTNEILSSALIIAALYVITYVLGALLGIAFGYGAIPSTFESISAASNAGLSSGIIQPSAPWLLKVFYILEMWMGRLEFVTLLALFASMIASIMPHRRARKARMVRRGSTFIDEDTQAPAAREAGDKDELV